jgi:predicted S18 family serine protease
MGIVQKHVLAVRVLAVWYAALVLTLIAGTTGTASAATLHREQLIPILGVTMDKRPIGTVATLVVSFEERDDQNGLSIHFKNSPGRFSPMAQTSIQQAIYRVARSVGVDPDSWTVILAVAEPGITIYGESLSAMVSISVLAMARGELIPADRVMTGAVSPDGRITPVGSVPLKVAAANEAHLRRVVIPDESDVADGDWHTPFLMQVSPVGSVRQAYQALTDHILIP